MKERFLDLFVQKHYNNDESWMSNWLEGLPYIERTDLHMQMQSSYISATSESRIDPITSYS